MKNLKITLFFLLALTLISVKVNAQTWNTLGNSTNPTEYFGTNNAQPIRFYTNGSQVMTLSTTGDLTVTGTITSQQSINLPSTKAYQINGNNFLWNNGITTNLYAGIGAANTTMIGGNNTFLGYNTGSENNNITNATAIGSQAKVNIDNGFVLGTDKTNVGIRTTTPQYALEVRGTIAAEKIILLKDNTIKDLQTTIDNLEKRLALLENKLNILTAKN
jgi:hypothetical protein